MSQKPRIHVAVLGAVAFEIDALVAALPSPEPSSLLGERCWMARFGALSVLVGTTGIGKVNGAIATSAILDRFRIGTVWNIGCAGAYESGPLRVGDVLISESALCGDEGVLGEKGVESARSIGIPLVSQGGTDYYDSFPLGDSQFFETVAALTPPGRYGLGERGLHTMPEVTSWEGDCFGSMARSGSFQILTGASLTVGMASGDPTTARKRFEQYRALAENMEGSAVAQTCLRYGVPMLECRGMSNVAGDRDKGHWRLREALTNCHAVVRNWLLKLSQDHCWPS
ncbi:MAG: hypothetical protein AB9873_20375 [Syntrophobacteraceae bacterium]